MICKNCNYILTGSESFCPDCGTPTVKEKDFSKDHQAQHVIFSPEKESHSPIFTNDAPAHLSPEKKEKKSKAGLYLVIVLCAVVFGTVAISVSDIIDFTPAIASLFSSGGEETTDEAETSLTEYDPLSAVVTPSVNYRTTVGYISGETGQALRKGPGNTYGQLDVLDLGSVVHIVGSESVNSDWVYVYVPEKDLYGWLSGAFISSSLGDINEEETNGETETTEEEVTTEESEIFNVTEATEPETSYEEELIEK